MDDDPGAAMDALLDRLVGVLSGSGTTDPIVTGEAADGQVVATLRGGRVESLTLDPRVLRDPERVVGHIVEAVNSAVDARPDAAGTGGSTVDALKAIQQDSLRLTSQINTSLLASLDRIKGA